VYREDWTQHYHPGKNILYNILHVTSFSVNYNKTHRSRLKYEEIKYNVHKMHKHNMKT